MQVGQVGGMEWCDWPTVAASPRRRVAEKLVPIAPPSGAYAHVIPRVDAMRGRSKCYE
jgi:hypothetical protein